MTQSTVQPVVLVVDDSAVERRLAGGLVEQCELYQVVYAEDGSAALDLLRARAIDLVLTDLRMEPMDGLALTEAVRTHHPAVPVILMTAHGSETIAIEALRRGAASYVPKASLARDLAATLEQVLVSARADQGQQRLTQALVQLEERFELENDPALVPALVSRLQDHLMRLHFCDQNTKIRVGVALEEAILNALYHGNLQLSSELRQDGSGAYERLARQRREQDPYAARRLNVCAKVSRAEGVFVVRDEGPGFDPSKLPDPTDPANLGMASGRGLLLIRTFMDDVAFNPSGNEITMRKRAPAAARK